MKVMNKIYDPPNPSYQVWTFWIQDINSDVIYKCSSRKQKLTQDEFYEVVYLHLPLDIQVTRAQCAIRNVSTRWMLPNDIDLKTMYDFTF